MFSNAYSSYKVLCNILRSSWQHVFHVTHCRNSKLNLQKINEVNTQKDMTWPVSVNISLDHLELIFSLAGGLCESHTHLNSGKQANDEVTAWRPESGKKAKWPSLVGATRSGCSSNFVFRAILLFWMFKSSNAALIPTKAFTVPWTPLWIHYTVCIWSLDLLHFK